MAEVLERAFTWILTGFLVISLLLILARDKQLIYNNNPPCQTGTGEPIVYESAAWVSRSAAIVADMDLSANPCQDFYQYACGRWERNSNSPVVRSYGSFVSREMNAERNIQLQKILEEPAAESSESGKRAIRFYQSCLQTKKTRLADTQSRESLLQLLDLIGGWSLIDDISNRSYLRKKWDFQEAFETIHNVLRVDVFFRWEVEWDFMRNLDGSNIYQHPIRVRHVQDKAMRPSSYPDGTTSVLISQVQEVVNFLLNSNSMISRNLNQQVLVEEAVKDIVEVESLLFLTYQLTEQNSMTPTSVAVLQTVSPSIDWSRFFQSAFSQVNITITPSRSVYVSSLEFLQTIALIIEVQLATERGRSKLKNYLSWQVAKSYFSAIKSRWNSNKEEAVYDDCVDITVEKFDLAVSSMFLRRSVDSESKKQLAEIMAKSVREAFKENLNHLNWLDEETRTSIKEKVDAITNLIGYPEFLLNAAKVDNLYEGLEIKSDEYLMNNFRLKNFNFRKQLTKLDRYVDKTQWTATFPNDIYYQPIMNQIVIPIGFLGQPLFDVTYPFAFNFGSVGRAIGHEVAHGFVGDNLLFDPKGNYRLWLNNATMRRITESGECFVRQYSSYVLYGYRINGQMTLAENLADQVGLNSAFQAFLSWTNNNTRREESLTLPTGATLTHQQLFFLSVAQHWCSKPNMELLKDPLQKHSPNRVRVIGPLSNMPEFSSAFQCPTGSFMNPAVKCRIW